MQATLSSSVPEEKGIWGQNHAKNKPTQITGSADVLTNPNYEKDAQNLLGAVPNSRFRPQFSEVLQNSQGSLVDIDSDAELARLRALVPKQIKGAIGRAINRCKVTPSTPQFKKYQRSQVFTSEITRKQRLPSNPKLRSSPSTFTQNKPVITNVLQQNPSRDKGFRDDYAFGLPSKRASRQKNFFDSKASTFALIKPRGEGETSKFFRSCNKKINASKALDKSEILNMDNKKYQNPSEGDSKSRNDYSESQGFDASSMRAFKGTCAESQNKDSLMNLKRVATEVNTTIRGNESKNVNDAIQKHESTGSAPNYKLSQHYVLMTEDDKSVFWKNYCKIKGLIYEEIIQ